MFSVQTKPLCSALSLAQSVCYSISRVFFKIKLNILIIGAHSSCSSHQGLFVVLLYLLVLMCVLVIGRNEDNLELFIMIYFSAAFCYLPQLTFNV